MKGKSVTIVGCGTMGSAVAFWLTIHNLECPKVKDLTLVDCDSISKKNLPYLFHTDISFIGKPKISVLKSILIDINPNLKIKTYHSRFPIRKNAREGTEIYTTEIIDCRDTPDSDSRTVMKLNYDGQFGLIQFNPKSRTKTKSVEYSFRNSNFKAMQIAGLALDMFLYNHKEGGIYAITENSSGGISIDRSDI